MSASPVQVQAQVQVDQVTVKKERAPRLPAKFAKFIQFGFYFVNSYNQQVTVANDGRTPLDADALFLALQVFGSVDEQKSFVQGFFDNNKDVNKQLRDVVKKFIKDNKPAPVRKPRAKKTKDTETTDETTQSSEEVKAETKPKSKRGRKPAVQANGNPDIVAEIVALAQNSDPIPNPLPTAESKTDDMKVNKKDDKKDSRSDKKAEAKAAKEAEKAKKDAEKAEAKAKKDASRSDKEAKKAGKAESKKETKPKKETKKDDKSDRVDTPVLPSDDEEEPLQVSILSLNGTQYLIDEQQTVYDFQSQDPIGKFDASTQTINGL